MKYLVALESSSKKAVLSRAGEYGLIVVDAQDYSADEIKTLKKAGAKVLSYINVGAIESDRSYFAQAKKAGLLEREYDNWDGEWWAKAQEPAWKTLVLQVARQLKEKGIDGFWTDNLDVYYMAKDEWKWKSSKVKTLYSNLVAILTELHVMGYIMTNGGDVFVRQLLLDGDRHKCIDAVNQETVISSIESYKGSGKFGEQDYDDAAYYKWYIAIASQKGKAVFLLEYTEDPKVRAKIEKFCAENGYSCHISTTLKLGSDLTVAAKKEPEKQAEGIMSSKCTVWDLLEQAAKFDGSPTVNEDVAAILKKHGHSSGKVAGCTNTIMAMFYAVGAIDIIGGYANNNVPFVSNAKKAGIWHSGSKGILPGDIVVFGRDGKSNHTELAVGNDLDISGNYNDACSRRKRSSHSSQILGYARPKYAAMPGMDNLQVTIAACDCLLDVYGSGSTREQQLSAYGSKNAKLIQDEINCVWGDNQLIARDMAIYAIAGRAGKDKYRRTRLGKYADKAQAEIEAIAKRSGKTTEQAAKDVINDKFGKNAIRKLLLKFCGYNPDTIQKKVNEILSGSGSTPADSAETKFRIHMLHFFRKDKSAYGACTAVYQYASDGSIAKCVLIDTAMSKVSSTVIADLKAQGVKQIDALIISHAHGDHYGGLTALAKAFPIKWLYLPDPTELDKYQKGYGNKLRQQAKKVSNYRWYKPGDAFITGEIRFDCLFQCKAKDLEEHDSHHFVNDQSPVCHITCGGFIWHTAGDLRNPGNRLYVAAMKKAGKSTKCHGLEFHWHTDANANNDALFEATEPTICGSNYHNPGWGSGRSSSKKRAEKVGAHCYACADDGAVCIDIQGRKATVKTEKSGKHDTFTI